MRQRSPLALVAFVLAVVLVACGGTDDPGSDTEAADAAPTTAGGGDEAPAETAGATDEPADAEPAVADPPEVGEMGSFTVNDVEYAVTLLNRCIPFSESDDDLDVQGLAQGQGAKINLYLAGDWVEASVDGSSLDEAFGSNAWSSDSVEDSTITADRWTGSATMDDAYGTGDTVDVTWDIQIPEEIRDCSL